MTKRELELENIVIELRTVIERMYKTPDSGNIFTSESPMHQVSKTFFFTEKGAIVTVQSVFDDLLTLVYKKNKK